MADSNSRHAGRKLAIAAAVAALLGTEAHAAPAGSVDFSIGNVVATGADGRARALGKGAELNAGDRILTNDGRAQIRFADGAYVSLQPNTDFAIREFRYDGRTDGTERGVFGLLKGAMRTVTGAIGRVNRAAYQIQTPTATIGIRGTGGRIQVFDDGATLLEGSSGVWSLMGPSKKQEYEVPAGQAMRTFPDPAKEPERVSEGPVLPPAPLLPEGEESPTILGGAGSPPMVPIAGNFTTASGGPAGVTGLAAAPGVPMLPNGTYEMFFQESTGAYNFGGPGGAVPVTFGPSGEATMLGANSLGGGTVVDAGNMSPVAWGRWIGPSVNLAYPGVATIDPTQGFHYVVGIPAPTLPSTGYVPFTFVAATKPTQDVVGNTPGTFTNGMMGVDFATGKVGLQFDLAFPGFNYQVATTGGAASPANSQVAITAGSKFGGTVPITPSGAVPAACVSACAANINGAFFGQTGPDAAGFVYDGGGVRGAAVFKK